MDIFQLLQDWGGNLIGLVIAVIILIAYIRREIAFKDGKLHTISSKNNVNTDDLYKILLKCFEIIRENDKIEDKIKRSEQVSYMIDKVEILKTKILKAHQKLLEDKGIVENVFAHPQYLMYKHIVVIFLRRMEVRCRERFEEMDGLFSKEENVEFTYQYIKYDFEKYKENMAQRILDEVAQIVQEEWIDLSIITSKENYDNTRELVPVVIATVFDVFQTAIDIQLKYDKKIKENDAELEKYIDEITNKEKP